MIQTFGCCVRNINAEAIKYLFSFISDFLFTSILHTQSGYILSIRSDEILNTIAMLLSFCSVTDSFAITIYVLQGSLLLLYIKCSSEKLVLFRYDHTTFTIVAVCYCAPYAVIFMHRVSFKPNIFALISSIQ